MDDRTLARFMSKIELQPNGCWRWTGTITEDGYGQFAVGDHANRLAHRESYKHFIGPIPDGMTLDHLCHSRAVPECPGGVNDEHRRCVNPFTDLEVVPGDENSRRGMSPAAINARKTHCDKGHEFTEENTYNRPDGGRECKTCRKDASRAWMAIHNPGVRHGTETHCPAGHEYDGDNLIINCRGSRVCRECKRKDQRERMRRKRAAEKAARLAA